jgi:hypothetical protein
MPSSAYEQSDLSYTLHQKKEPPRQGFSYACLAALIYIPLLYERNNMTSKSEYILPGTDGNWENIPAPVTLEDAQERIKVLEEALSFYSDARTYAPDSIDNEYPAYSELIRDKGLRARIGRLALNEDHYRDWLVWSLNNQQ